MKNVSTIIAAAAVAVAFTAPVTGFAAQSADSIYVAPDHSLSARTMLGAAVYNAQHEKIGTIQTVMVKPSGATAVVISVGDYLGTGPKMVAVPLSHLSLQGHDAMEMANATKSELAGLPVYAIAGG